MWKIRKLDRKDNLKTKPLYDEVFSEDIGAFSDYYYDFKAKNNTIYIAQEGGGPIRAMVHINPVNVSMFRHRRNLSYIVAVATEEQFRHQGLMRQLLTAAMKDLQKKGEPFAFLMPADEAIYTPFGFRRAWNWLWEEDICDTLSGGIDRPIWLCDDGQVEELCRTVNRKLSEKYDIFVYRTVPYYRALDYEQKASGGEVRVIFDHNEHPESSLRALREKFPPMMMRIMSFPAYIQLVHAQHADHFILSVTDPVLPENSGLYEITLGAEGSQAVRINAGAEETEGAAQVDICEVPLLLGRDDPCRRVYISEVV